MKKEDTKNIILKKALELFSEKGYNAVSVDEIAKAVGIKAPSLYNHFSGKRAIFNAIVNATSKQYETDTDKINIHVQNVKQDISVFTEISEESLINKVKELFDYSLHNETISRFRKMMTIEQFRSEDLAELYYKRYVERIINYHTEIFCNLISEKKLKNEEPKTLALMYVAPIITLIEVCDRQPEKYNECIEKLEKHIRLFYKTFGI